MNQTKGNKSLNLLAFAVAVYQQNEADQ